MNKLLLAGVMAGVLATSMAMCRADDLGDRFQPVEFVVLPDGVRFPEGITANPATGDIYVGTFDFGPNSNALLRYSKNGKLLARKDMGATPLLGLGFGPDGKVYVLNDGALTGGTSKVQRIAANFDASSPLENLASVPSIGAPAPRPVGNPDGSSDTISFGSGAAVPNGMVFDAAGNLYFSDSFQGAIFRIANPAACSANCPVSVVSHDPLLATAGFPPFGANGLALSADGKTLFIANTGDSRVLRMDLASSTVSVLAESVHGADGLLLDDDGRLWVAANQADQLVVLDDKGFPLFKVGDFEGIRHDGAPRGFLFPASMVMANGFMYVTNLSLPLTAAVGDEPEENVTRWNVMRLRISKHH
jgi:DNA-binding beta-propeller fold protein YncE